MTKTKIILNLLAKHGELSNAKLSELLGITELTLRHHAKLLRVTKRIYTAGWVFPPEGGYPMRIWKIGNQPDAPKPKGKKKPPPAPEITFLPEPDINVVIQPDEAASWLMNPNYLAAKRYERTLKSGEPGVRQNTWQSCLKRAIDRGISP
jgi:hypothetical protein